VHPTKSLQNLARCGSSLTFSIADSRWPLPSLWHPSRCTPQRLHGNHLHICRPWRGAFRKGQPNSIIELRHATAIEWGPLSGRIRKIRREFERWKRRTDCTRSEGSQAIIAISNVIRCYRMHWFVRAHNRNLFQLNSHQNNTLQGPNIVRYIDKRYHHHKYKFSFDLHSWNNYENSIKITELWENIKFRKVEMRLLRQAC